MGIQVTISLNGFLSYITTDLFATHFKILSLGEIYFFFLGGEVENLVLRT